MTMLGSGAEPPKIRGFRRISLRGRLVLLVVGSILPLLFLALVQQYRDYQGHVSGTRREIAVLANALSRQVAQELDSYAEGLTALAASPGLRRNPPDMEQARHRAEALKTGFAGANITMLRPDGTHLMDLRLAPGEASPNRKMLASLQRVVTTGEPAVSGIRRSQVDGKWIFDVDVPVKDVDGHVLYILSMNPPIDRFMRILREGLPASWISSVYDETLNQVARSSDGAKYIGSPVAAGLRQSFAERKSGMLEDGDSREGTPVVRAFSAASPFGWSVVVGLPRAELVRPARREALVTIAIGVSFLVVTIATAIYIANTIRHPIASLTTFAADRDGLDSLPATGLPEVDEVAEALWHSANDRRRSHDGQVRTLLLLGESEGRMRQVIDGAMDGFVQFDQDLMITEWNRQAETIFGWSRDDVVGTKLTDRLVPLVTQDRALWEMRRFLETGRGQFIRRRREVEAMLRSGKRARIEQSVTVGRGQDGRYLFNAFFRDLTQKIATENQLRQSQKMEAIGNLTGGMAHDFNNLLTIIMGSLDGASEMIEADEPARELLNEAQAAASQGADLTRGLLAFARQQPLRPRETDVNALLRAHVQLLRRLIGETVEVSLMPGADVWPVIIDPTQLQSALANLASNARDAMPNGGRLIVETANRYLDVEYAASHPEVTTGDYVLIQITDTGNGIPEDQLGRIFEPFFTTKGPGKGTGLGLAMVFGFIKQSRGHVSVYSEPGVGTTFRLYLPRMMQTAEVTGSARATETPSGTGGGKVVLVVDDNASVRRVVVRQLQQLGYQVLACDRPASALEMLKEQPVDLLFTDVVMPGGVGGVELARMVQGQYPDLKVLLTSGFPTAHVNGDDPGSFRLLSKPYNRRELAAVISELMG
jgi:PAS domain S-box-containing protein